MNDLSLAERAGDLLEGTRGVDPVICPRQPILQSLLPGLQVVDEEGDWR